MRKENSCKYINKSNLRGALKVYFFTDAIFTREADGRNFLWLKNNLQNDAR